MSEESEFLYKEKCELTQIINEALELIDGLEYLDSEQLYELEQILKGKNKHVPRID